MKCPEQLLSVERGGGHQAAGATETLHRVDAACNGARSALLRPCWQEDGSYAGFDSHEFTSRSGGKREALQYVKQASAAAAAGAGVQGAP